MVLSKYLVNVNIYLFEIHLVICLHLVNIYLLIYNWWLIINLIITFSLSKCLFTVNVYLILFKKICMSNFFSIQPTSYGKNDFAEEFKYLAWYNLKIILLDRQNNYLCNILKLIAKISKSFAALFIVLEFIYIIILTI